jgi:hypothetical protein
MLFPAKGSQMAIRALSASSAPTKNTTAATVVDGTAANLNRRELGVTARLLVIGCLGILVAGSTGCTLTSGVRRIFSTQECVDDFMVSYRNRALAEKAWYRLKDRFPKDRYSREFKDGFISGYVDIASGGYGCSPSVAPSRYWGWRYQSGHGQQAVNSWFHAFPLGVQAGEQDGVGNWQQIRTNGMASTNLVIPATGGEGSEATNPFDIEEEFVPLPDTIETFDSGAAGSGAFEGARTERTQPSLDLAVEQLPSAMVNDGPELELVMQPRVVGRLNAATVSVGNNMNDQALETTPVVIDDIFGSSSEPIFNDTDSSELPFTFE